MGRERATNYQRLESLFSNTLSLLDIKLPQKSIQIVSWPPHTQDARTAMGQHVRDTAGVSASVPASPSGTEGLLSLHV